LGAVGLVIGLGDDLRLDRGSGEDAGKREGSPRALHQVFPEHGVSPVVSGWSSLLPKTDVKNSVKNIHL